MDKDGLYRCRLNDKRLPNEFFKYTGEFQMKTKAWITINDRGSMRLTKGNTQTQTNEVSVRVNINIPDALFQKPRLEATITIPEEAIGPEMISSDVIHNCQDAIKETTGLDMIISVARDEE